MRVSPQPGGTVEKKDIRIWYETKTNRKSSTPLFLGSGSSWDIIDEMEEPLPFHFLGPSVPSWMLVLMKSNLLVTRRLKIHYREPAVHEEYYYYSLLADKYHQNNITIRIHVPKKKGVDESVVSRIIARKIKDNVVEEILLKQLPDEHEDCILLEASTSTLRSGERFRVTWPHF